MHLDAKSKKIYLIGGALGVGVVGWIYLHNKSSAAQAAATASTDPSTEIDPATGFPYGSAQDEAALSTESASLQDTGTSATYTPINTSAAAVQTNAAWAQAAQAMLVAIGYDPETVAGALGAYLGGIPLTPTQVTIVQAALAEEGPPPVGSFSIIQSPGSPVIGPGPGGGGTTGTGTGTVTSPQNQTGTVYSATTGDSGKVSTTNGGYTWNYVGVKSHQPEPQKQSGTVHSQTTGLTGKVSTTNGGQTWNYVG